MAPLSGSFLALSLSVSLSISSSRSASPSGRLEPVAPTAHGKVLAHARARKTRISRMHVTFVAACLRARREVEGDVNCDVIVPCNLVSALCFSPPELGCSVGAQVVHTPCLMCTLSPRTLQAQGCPSGYCECAGGIRRNPVDCNLGSHDDFSCRQFCEVCQCALFWCASCSVHAVLCCVACVCMCACVCLCARV